MVSDTVERGGIAVLNSIWAAGMKKGESQLAKCSPPTSWTACAAPSTGSDCSMQNARILEYVYVTPLIVSRSANVR